MKNKDSAFFKSLFKKLEDNKHLLKPISEAYTSNKEIMVSISCATYNHEKWIAQALDGFLSQMVDFNVEIIVHDDASTDNTANIIREYEKRYPNVIKAIYEKENQYTKCKENISNILRNNKKGKYSAVCEGDDYWTDPYKLYLQVNALELNQNSHFCVHKVRVNHATDNSKSGFLPKKKYGNTVFLDNDFINIISNKYSFQTSSYFFRTSDHFKYMDNKPIFAKKMPTGDEAVIRYFGALGQTVYFERTMSVYNQCLKDSWTDKQRKQNNLENNNQLIKQYLAIMEFNKWSKYKYGNDDIVHLKMMLLEKRYIEIIENKLYRRLLKSYSKRTYCVVCLKVRHPKLYKLLKRITAHSN